MTEIREKDLLRYENGYRTPVFQSASGLIRLEARGVSISSPKAEIWFYDSGNISYLFQTHTARKTAEGCECAFTFDPVSLCIYQDAISFEIRLQGFDSVSCFLLTEENLADRKVSESSSLIFTDECGNRLVPVLQADKMTVRNVSIIPKNVLFMGNSILLGMNLNAYGAKYAYGMCASSPEHDYFYHVSQAILRHAPECRFRRLYGSPFEHSDTPEKFEAWWCIDANPCTGHPACESFTRDLDLIILQCGDNVNTDEKEANFEEYAPILLRQIKKRCPNARIIWVHSWYNYHRTCDKIRQLSEQWRFEEVDIHDLAVPEHQASHGQEYLTPDSSAVVRDTWITHPGDLGMEEIADRILSKIGV